MAETRLYELLSLERCLVFGVLAQVAQLARTLDLFRQLVLQLSLELLQLALEPLQDGCLDHGG